MIATVDVICVRHSGNCENLANSRRPATGSHHKIPDNGYHPMAPQLACSETGASTHHAVINKPPPRGAATWHRNNPPTITVCG